MPIILLALAAVAGADGPEVAAESVRAGSLRSRLSDAPADLVLLYGGEQEGELGTCGCDARPRGSLARVDAYRRAVEEGAPVLLLNPGGYLATQRGDGLGLRADAIARDRRFLEGLELGGWDAANLGYADAIYQGRHGLSPLAVSANVRGPGVATHRLFELDGLRVAVTGVTREALPHRQADGWTFAEPVGALAALVPTLDADLVVVLAYEPGALAAELAAVDGVDVLVEAGGFTGRYDPFVEGGAVWVRSRHRTEQLGELRLVVRDGAVVSATDRKIDLDARIPSTRALRRLERRAEREVRRELVGLYGHLLR